MASYKQKCWKCKEKWVIASWKNRYPVCYDCEKDEISKPIKDPKMKKLFKIPEEFYKKSSFLRSVKRNYLRFENLTEKQIEAFKTTVEKFKEEEKKEKKGEE